MASAEVIGMREVQLPTRERRSTRLLCSIAATASEVATGEFRRTIRQKNALCPFGSANKPECKSTDVRVEQDVRDQKWPKLWQEWGGKQPPRSLVASMQTEDEEDCGHTES